MKNRITKIIVSTITITLLFSCKPNNDSYLASADGTDGNWLLHGLNYAETRFSPLNQINESNIKELGLDWSLDLGLKRGIEATPIIKDGIMYLTGPWSIVFCR